MLVDYYEYFCFCHWVKLQAFTEQRGFPLVQCARSGVGFFHISNFFFCPTWSFFAYCQCLWGLPKNITHSLQANKCKNAREMKIESAKEKSYKWDYSTHLDALFASLDGQSLFIMHLWPRGSKIGNISENHGSSTTNVVKHKTKRHWFTVHRLSGYHVFRYHIREILQLERHEDGNKEITLVESLAEVSLLTAFRKQKLQFNQLWNFRLQPREELVSICETRLKPRFHILQWWTFTKFLYRVFKSKGKCKGYIKTLTKSKWAEFIIFSDSPANRSLARKIPCMSFLHWIRSCVFILNWW